MFSVSEALKACLLGLLFCAGATVAQEEKPVGEAQAQKGAAPLRVCADPNNMPFSNDRGEGFENMLATMIARDLDRPLTYVWWPQRRGFIRNTLKAGRCDLVMGIPAHFEMAQTTKPYYRSSFAFITRTGDELDIASFDDPRLKKLDIGIHVIGDDYSNPPPAMALAMRGIRENVHGYSIYGDYSRHGPTRTLIDAVASGEIDVAIAWGPLAGYFAAQAEQPLTVTPLADQATATAEPMMFSIAMGVRHGDDQLKKVVEGVLERRHQDVRALLQHYQVPLLEPANETASKTAGSKL